MVSMQLSVAVLFMAAVVHSRPWKEHNHGIFTFSASEPSPTKYYPDPTGETIETEHATATELDIEQLIEDEHATETELDNEEHNKDEHTSETELDNEALNEDEHATETELDYEEHTSEVDHDEQISKDSSQEHNEDNGQWVTQLETPSEVATGTTHNTYEMKGTATSRTNKMSSNENGNE